MGCIRVDYIWILMRNHLPFIEPAVPWPHKAKDDFRK